MSGADHFIFLENLLTLRKQNPKKARELHMGVRSRVTLTEKRLKNELENNQELQKLWKKIKKIHRVSCWNLFCKEG